MQEFLKMLFGPAEQRMQPDPRYDDTSPRYRKLRRRMASMVGVLCLGLPLVSWFVGQNSQCFPDSISHFYYWQVWGSVFVAVLSAIAVMLIIFRGENHLESWISSLGGVLLLIVALVPTFGSGCEGAQSFAARGFFQMVNGTRSGEAFFGSKIAGQLHSSAAVVFMLVLVYLCFWGFTRVKKGQKQAGGLTPEKQYRNAIYRICGVVMSAALIAGVIMKVFQGEEAVRAMNGMFWIEFFCLIPFGIAWLIKGRIFGAALTDQGEVTS